MNILLDYFFPITVINPTAQASTAFLKQACLVVKPKAGVTVAVPTLCTSMAEVAALTDNTEAQQFFNAGMSRIYILPSADLTIATELEGHEFDFYTLLISSDYTDANVTGADFGDYTGVIAVCSNDEAFLEAQSIIENRCAFYKSGTNGVKNMVFAFAKLLGNQTDWANQQYITMPFADDVTTIGDALNLFDKKISFVLDDSQYGKRLGLFACGQKAIVAPYIVRNLMIDMQSKALAYISANQPSYTKVHAALIEDELTKVITGDEETTGYVNRGWIEAGTVEVKLEQDNWVASGYINISEPGALWRINGQLKQTL